MIRKLLVANRGEIACRIMRTCRKMGIRTVAVYSDADRDALHVATADEAVRIGPAEASGSYLNVDAIMDAARQTGANAIHPGYGFLSERVALAERCVELGIVWVGPNPDAITRMGSKIESKRIAEAAGVPCVPGYHGFAQDDASLEKAAREIGFPILIKASAGGGGRGMRAVQKAEDLAGALALARAEAQAGFGDPSLLIEKLIQRPRHIEVQLAGDKHGNLVHLFERECSIQRNYQKLIEEAPAPNLSQTIRDALFDAATKLGRAIGYDSLGTVEFILDADGGGPWFLEMNTRLQVEHPVTEFVTGLDLVELQIRVADGEFLPITQDAVTVTGTAIEARINAEDPAAGYRPALGEIRLFKPPNQDGVRVDTGVRSGSVVTPYYDSLLAKIIAYGPDRGVASARLSASLGEFAILGITSSQAFLRDIVDHPRFRAGELTTRFIGETFPDGWAGQPDDDDDSAAAAAVWALTREANSAAPNLGPWATLGGFRVSAAAGHAGWVALAIGTPSRTIEAEIAGKKGRYAFRQDGIVRSLEIAIDGDRATLSLDGLIREYSFVEKAGTISLGRDGRAGDFGVTPRIETAGSKAAADAAGAGRVAAPMPGLISQLNVVAGQSVALGDTVIVLEAMKLMYSLPAQISGRVTEIFCAAGDTVPSGAPLVEIEAEG
ncbi:MAG: biotin carboxylase / biotin carboxyl carrier protein [Rhodospirillales bacterium]|nr:biotin carboxylase / biotin carboxyl carrier protein [Rhodospirillales bacterium]